jgi:hypothetical protein
LLAYWPPTDMQYHSATPSNSSVLVCLQAALSKLGKLGEPFLPICNNRFSSVRPWWPGPQVIQISFRVVTTRTQMVCNYEELILLSRCPHDISKSHEYASGHHKTSVACLRYINIAVSPCTECRTKSDVAGLCRVERFHVCRVRRSRQGLVESSRETVCNRLFTSLDKGRQDHTGCFVMF